MTSEAQTVEKTDPWREHCRDAVRKFVMNVVVIDNDPILDRPSGPPLEAAYEDSGMDNFGNDHIDDFDEDSSNDDEPEIDHSPLYIREITDAFSGEGIACAFVFPDENKGDNDSIKKRVLAAAKSADIVVIDWYLSDSNSILTKEILQEIAAADVAENSRMRLICIYTGQPDIASVVLDAVGSLSAGGLDFDAVEDDEGYAVGQHHSLIVLNKYKVDGKNLPCHLLDALTRFADGLLPAFALAAVAAIRRNIHHIITRFSSDHDAAYVANRLITDPPGDVAELMRELFVSECDTALGLEKVADNYLEPNQILNWLDKKKQPIQEGEFKVDDTKHKIDRNFIDSLLENGVSDDCVMIRGRGRIIFNEGKRGKVSAALHGSKVKAKSSEGNLSRFVSLKREAFGNTKIFSDEGWIPSLTLGTLLRQKVLEDEGKYLYFYCLTPACDTIRLKGKERPFLLLELQDSKGMTNLIVGEENGPKKLRIEPKPYNVRSVSFRGCEQTGRVQGSQTAGTRAFYFDSTSDNETPFLWLGEVRRSRANRDMADLNREWLRFGIKDLEYLRLAGRGKTEF